MSYDEEQIARLLALLPPAPAAWVEAAQGLPALRGEIDRILERAKQDGEFRRRLAADPSAALVGEGFADDPRIVELLRTRLPAE